MFNPEQMLQVLSTFEEETGVSQEKVIEALKDAFQKAYNKEVDPEATVEVEIDAESGQLTAYNILKIVTEEELEDDLTELSLEEARKIDVKYGLGDVHKVKLDLEDFSRLAALHVLQVVKQNIIEAKKELIYAQYRDTEGTVMNVEIESVQERFALFNLDKTMGFMPLKNQIPGETLIPGQRVKVYIEEVQEHSKGWQVVMSRAHENLVKELFEGEVPEILEGIVEIKSISRIAGERTKMAVYSKESSIDPIGSCIGKRGVRANAVVSQINGEKVDIVLWNEDPVRFITNAMSPSKVVGVKFTDEEMKRAIVIVPDSQLSLAIGKRGHSAKLAVRLTGWNLDIKSETDARAEGVEFEENGNMNEPTRSPRPQRREHNTFDADMMSINEDKEIIKAKDEKSIYEEFGVSYTEEKPVEKYAEKFTEKYTEKHEEKHEEAVVKPKAKKKKEEFDDYFDDEDFTVDDDFEEEFSGNDALDEASDEWDQYYDED